MAALLASILSRLGEAIGGPRQAAKRRLGTRRVPDSSMPKMAFWRAPSASREEASRAWR
jgi:hypothetical protein